MHLVKKKNPSETPFTNPNYSNGHELLNHSDQENNQVKVLKYNMAYDINPYKLK